ncbi:MAG: MBOAT family O-acyltransferase [Candidatus Auribacterota bacterium]|nr:MBOAT family O-acyltransferase [Candidatus Auribacterota bacterium]
MASYVFYSFWDWRFLSLILISTILDYICGIKIFESKNIKKRKLFLFFSILGNLSILGFFKYFNFFAYNLQLLLQSFGIHLHPLFLRIVLPVGISFYTFQTMSYTLDIYRRQLKPTKKILDFALFVAFFPQLVAGPIERAKHLLPQMLAPRRLDLEKFYQGCYLIFWGIFMKVFVADNLAALVDPVFKSQPPYNGLKVLIALYAFAFQIFCDFAGYSNIARGLGKCMGFDIMINFNLPYLSTNPSEFWQRWHISLSSWLRDYLYIPLGGNRKGNLTTYRNLAITMFLGGLWHGAAWTFITWGIYQGFLLIIYKKIKPFLGKVRTPKSQSGIYISLFIRIIFFFNLTCLGWLFFRANSMSQAWYMFQGIILNFQFVPGTGIKYIFFYTVFYTFILIILQICQYPRRDLLFILNSNYLVRIFLYVICFYLLIIYGVTTGNEFIYFQF